MIRADSPAQSPGPAAAVWRKSTHSNPSGNCVEMARLPTGEMAIRNSRHPEGGTLIFTRTEWETFVRGVKNGELG